MQPAMVIVNKNSYSSLRYSNKKRIFSYAHQVSCLIDEEVREILEIGPGPGLVTEMLRLLNFKVTTMDVSPDVHADVQADIREIPFRKNSFDAVLCCQVLEHLPFSDFTKALALIRKVARKSAVISLPDATRHLDLFLNLPKIGRINKSLFFSPGKKDNSVQMKEAGHYWEIGYPGTELKKITKSMDAAGWHIAKTWRVTELPWHRFFLLH